MTSVWNKSSTSAELGEKGNKDKTCRLQKIEENAQKWSWKWEMFQKTFTTEAINVLLL